MTSTAKHVSPAPRKTALRHACAPWQTQRNGVARFIERQNDLGLSHSMRPRSVHSISTMPETQRMLGFSRPGLRFPEI